jgi:hypothetical protein
MGEFDDPLRLLAQKLGAGISDVRSKLIDEGWFGRSGAEPMRDIPEQGQPAFGTDAWVDWANAVTREASEGNTLESFERQWAVREPGSEPERAGPKPDLGMDR